MKNAIIILLLALCVVLGYLYFKKDAVVGAPPAADNFTTSRTNDIVTVKLNVYPGDDTALVTTPQTFTYELLPCEAGIIPENEINPEDCKVKPPKAGVRLAGDTTKSVIIVTNISVAPKGSSPKK